MMILIYLINISPDGIPYQNVQRWLIFGFKILWAVRRGSGVQLINRYNRNKIQLNTSKLNRCALIKFMGYLQRGTSNGLGYLFHLFFNTLETKHRIKPSKLLAKK